MANYELSSGHSEEHTRNQHVERNSLGQITRIVDGDRDSGYSYDEEGRLQYKLVKVGIGEYSLGFATGYLYEQTASGKEMVIELTGSRIDKEQKRIPLGVNDAAIWISQSNANTQLEFVQRKDGRIHSEPVAKDAFRRNYDLIYGPVVSLESGKAELLLPEGERALMRQFHDEISYFDSKGKEHRFDEDGENDTQDTHIEDLFPHMFLLNSNSETNY